MTSATYKTLLDLDRDGFMCQDVISTDALNIIPTPVYWWLIGTVIHTSGETITKTQGATIYGLYYYRVTTGTNVAGGIRFGDDGVAINDIAVSASTAYRWTIWVRGVSGYTGVPMTARVSDEDSTALGNTSFTLTADWQKVTVNVTTAVGTTYVRIIVRKDADATDITFDVTGFMLVLGTTTPAAFNAGDPSNAYDEITAYVATASWSNGMSDGMEQVAEPATLSLMVNNHNREFLPENLGAELLTNSGPTFTFSGDNPVGWTVFGESAADPEVSEVGAGEAHGGTGTGSINFYKTSTTASLYIYQNILAVGARYRCTIDISYIGAGGVQIYSGGAIIAPTYQTTGIKTFVFTAIGTAFAIVVVGAPDITIASVSVKQGGAYYGLSRGMLCSIRATAGAVVNQQLYVGKIANKRPSVGVYGAKQMEIMCEDALAKLVNIEYEPPLQTDVTTDEVLTEMFDNVVVPYPYLRSFWVLGTDAASTLGLNTILADSSTFLEADTGYTELEYAGDNSDSGRGVMANAFIRDVVAAEMGGRFFFDTRTSKFTFHNRNRDVLNETIFASLTYDDVEGGDYVDGEDVINHVTINYQPRKLGEAAVVIYTATNVPLQIAAGETKTLTARYRDPNQEDARIGAVDCLIPVVGTDIVAGFTELNSNAGRYLGVSVDFNAQSAKVALTNSHGWRVMYINTLQLKGTPIYTYDRQFVEVGDANSQVENDTESKRLDIPLVGDEALITDYAYNVLSRFKDPASLYKNVRFFANKNDTRMANALSMVIGSRIALVDSYLGHDADYVVVGEKHVLTAGGDHTHEVNWIFKPVTRQTFWILGVVGKSELGSTTYLGF